MFDFENTIYLWDVPYRDIIGHPIISPSGKCVLMVNESELARAVPAALLGMKVYISPYMVMNNTYFKYTSSLPAIEYLLTWDEYYRIVMGLAPSTISTQDIVSSTITAAKLSVTTIGDLRTTAKAQTSCDPFKAALLLAGKIDKVMKRPNRYVVTYHRNGRKYAETFTDYVEAVENSMRLGATIIDPSIPDPEHDEICQSVESWINRMIQAKPTTLVYAGRDMLIGIGSDA